MVFFNFYWQPEEEPGPVDQAKEVPATTEEPAGPPAWVPPSLDPTDTAILINLIVGCANRGALRPDEFALVHRVYDKLLRHCQEHVDTFQLAPNNSEVVFPDSSTDARRSQKKQRKNKAHH